MSRYGSRKSFDLEWIERWARCVNEDRILPVIGKFFNNRFVLGVDETEFPDRGARRQDRPHFRRPDAQ